MDSENLRLIENLFLGSIIIIYMLSEFILHFFLKSNYKTFKKKEAKDDDLYFKEFIYLFLNKDASYRKEKYRKYKFKELFLFLRYASIFGVFYFFLLVIFVWIV